MLNPDNLTDEEVTMLLNSIGCEIFFPECKEFEMYDMFTSRRLMEPLENSCGVHKEDILYPYSVPSNKECLALLPGINGKSELLAYSS